MVGLQVENTNEKIVFSIDKNNFTEEVLIKLMKIARAEYLIEKAAFDDSVLQFGEELKKQWWEENKNNIIPEK